MIQSKMRESEKALLRIEYLAVVTDQPDEFLERLEYLCRQYCHEEDFFFKYVIEE